MFKRFVVLAMVAVLVVGLVPMVSAQDGGDLSGTTVTVFGAFTDPSEVGAVNDGYAKFEEETGVDVVYEGSSDFEILINARVEAGDPPDIACFPQPGLMKRFTDQIVDVGELLGEDYLLQQYNPSWLDMARSDGKILGVWTRVIVKSLVWYNPLTFEDGDYAIPETWDELMALSDQMVADGLTPWYAPMESGAATGWVGTDWIEDIMLRTTTLENYDKWTVPASLDERLPFASPEVKRAFEIFGSVAKNPDYMYGGVDAMLDNRFFDTGVPIVEGDAGMAKMGSFMPGWLFEAYPDLEIAPDGDLWYFFFPPIDEEFGKPVLTSGDVCSVFNDRPEVRALVEWLTKAESLKPGIEAGIFISPHLDSQVDWYRDSEKGLAEILLNADSVRFDGGDLQPAPVGQGSFWQGVVDYVSDVKDLDTILAEIDAAWPTE